MMTQTIAGKTYEQRACFACGGAGEAYDATNADKVCTGGTAVSQCFSCRGEGFTLHLVVPTVAPIPKPAPVEIGDIPAWML